MKLPQRKSQGAVYGFLLVLFALISAAAAASDDFAQLKPDEGLLLLVIDNGVDASSLRIDGPGMLDADLAKGLADGVNLRLMRFPAGEYRWTRVSQLGGRRFFNLPQKPEYTFHIKAGAINYPGDFLMQKLSGGFSLFTRTNRAALAMVQLDRAFPGVRGRFPWQMDVTSPDPFPAFFAEQVQGERMAALLDSANADAKKQAQQDVPEEFAKLFKDLFNTDATYWPRLSPSGELLAYVEVRGDSTKVIAVDLASGASLVLGTYSGDVAGLEWGDDRCLLIDYGGAPVTGAGGSKLTYDLRGAEGVSLVRFGAGPLSEKSVEQVVLPNTGLVDALPNDPRRAIVVHTDSAGQRHVFEIDKRLRRYNPADFRSEHRLDKGLERLHFVFPDRQGRLAAAIVASGKDEDKDTGRTLMVNRDGAWRALRTMPDDARLVPYALDADGANLIVLTDIGRAQVEIARLSLRDGEVGESIMALPGTDIEAPLLRDRDRAVLGGVVYSGGIPQPRYLERADGAAAERIAAKFPGASAMLWDESRDRKRAIVSLYSETDPGQYFLLDTAANKLEKLFDSREPFKVAKPVASTAFTVRSPDGLDIQAFLTLPGSGSKPFPLIVMPHGGPIGIADNRGFNPGVQILANRGFAVLRVNYRGSAGGGKTFLQAGHGKWGREIEQDIEQALDHALTHFPLDRQRVALFGASYGGYSTLMELVRAPERFRCGVAVSGVTDLPLLFSSSDWNPSKKSMARMKDIVGDPDSAMDELRRYSPDYQFQRLQRPLLLVHGTNDVRVSFEHAWRMRSLLSSVGRPPEWLPLPGADHSLSRPNDRLALQVTSDRFLHDCLGSVGAGEPAAVPKPAQQP